MERFVMRYPAFCAFVLTLAACGPAPDVADNIPQVGKWSDRTQILSVEVNGGAVDQSEFADQLPKDRTKEFCGEPYVRTEDELRQTLLTDKLKGCTITAYKNDGSRHQISGSCTDVVKGADDSSAMMSLAGYVTPTEIKGRLSVQAVVTGPDGDGESVSIEFERRLTRLGDC
jgi:hypothetical protein